MLVEEAKYDPSAAFVPICSIGLALNQSTFPNDLPTARVIVRPT